MIINRISQSQSHSGKCPLLLKCLQNSQSNYQNMRETLHVEEHVKFTDTVRQTDLSKVVRLTVRFYPLYHCYMCHCNSGTAIDTSLY